MSQYFSNTFLFCPGQSSNKKKKAKKIKIGEGMPYGSSDKKLSRKNGTTGRGRAFLESDCVTGGSISKTSSLSKRRAYGRHSTNSYVTHESIAQDLKRNEIHQNNYCKCLVT